VVYIKNMKKARRTTVDNVNRFYKELEFTFKEVAWDKLFQEAAIGEDLVEFVSAHAEMFWEEPSINHAGLLHWLCEGKRYVSVARVDSVRTTMMVVPRWEKTPFWDWDHGGENLFIWRVPEMSVEEILRETEQDYLFCE
jgi:hypothetical protein